MRDDSEQQVEVLGYEEVIALLRRELLAVARNARVFGLRSRARVWC